MNEVPPRAVKHVIIIWEWYDFRDERWKSKIQMTSNRVTAPPWREKIGKTVIRHFLSLIIKLNELLR